MKLYFLLPGKDLINGLVFLYDDSGCVKMADYICVGGVADVYVEYHGEEDDDSSSGSDYEDEIIEENETGVITQRLCSPMKQRRSSIGQVGVDHDALAVIEGSFSQVLDPTQVDHDEMALTEHADKQNSDSDSDSDSEYIGHTDDSGEDSEVVELRRHARKFKKRMRDTRSWIGRDATGPVPTDLIANLEEQIEKEEMDWNYDSSDEYYNYDEDSDGHIRRRKTTFPRYNPKSEVPHFALTMVFRSKNQLCKALRRYGLVTKRSILFMKSESDRQTKGTSAAAGSTVAAGSSAAAGSSGAPRNRFKPPRKRSAAGSSAAPSSSGAKRGRKRAAQTFPTYQYFTCSGNY
ncbi:hypothetical protein D1007_18763 [Hordeum vulgare]|nr:hypothetical protein D1007_18763 [Hordeum vulgare]